MISMLRTFKHARKQIHVSFTIPPKHWSHDAGSCLFFIIEKRRQNLSEVRLKTCAVDCVCYIRAFRGACKCNWKNRSSSHSPFPASRSARNQGHDKRGEIGMSLITCGSIHQGHEWFSDDSRGRRDLNVFGCSIM